MKQNDDKQKDAALRIVLQREGEKLQMPTGLTERVMAQIREEGLDPEKQTGRVGKRPLWWLAAAAAVLLCAFILITPHIRESREMTLYEGSYVEEDGQRIEDYHLIKSDIREALSMADQAEAYTKSK